MTIQDTRTTGYAPPSAVPRQGAGALRHAADILARRHQVSEMFAYEMLVHCAVDAGTSVREMAYAVIDGAVED